MPYKIMQLVFYNWHTAKRLVKRQRSAHSSNINRPIIKEASEKLMS